jgi:serine/threonine-protein kinase PknG
LHDPDGAIEAYDRVPDSSSAYLDAQVAKIDTALEREPPLDAAGLSALASVMADLDLGDEERARLTAAVLQSARRLVDGTSSASDPASLLGYTFDAQGVSLGLEASYREPSRTATTRKATAG